MDKALELNQEVFEGKHLRVDRAFGSKELDRKSENDFNTTIYVGNLPFVVGEEEVRQHFEPCGTITNVRLIREPKTFIGKGIGYVMFENKEAMRKAVDTKHDSSFKGRKIRVKKAVEPKRLEKKQRKKTERAQAHASKYPEKNKDSDDSEEEEIIPRGKLIGDMMDSEDSEDEKFSKFGGVQQRVKNQDLCLDNIIALNKRKRQNMLKEMISNRKGMMQQPQQKSKTDLFKKETFKEVITKRIEKRRVENIKKYNSYQGKNGKSIGKKSEKDKTKKPRHPKKA